MDDRAPAFDAKYANRAAKRHGLIIGAPPTIQARSTAETDVQEQRNAAWKPQLLLTILGTKVPGEIIDEPSAMVLAILGVGRKLRPRFAKSAWIDKDGRVRADFVNLDGTRIRNRPLCTTEQYRSFYQRLGERLKLTDLEYLEMFSEFRKWIGRDMRVDQDQKEMLK